MLALGSGTCTARQCGAILVNDLDVAFRLCTVHGGQGASSGDGCPGGDAIRARSCSVALYDCDLLGGSGGVGVHRLLEL
jgi:hypothetical protein